MDDFIDKIYYSEDDTIKVIRTLLGTLLIICIMICCVTCFYKYAQCQDKKDKERTTYITVQNKFPQEV